MKEYITPSEQKLKANFDQYEAPMDLEAFDQFKAALNQQDKPDNPRRFIIIGLSTLIPVILILGLTFGDFSAPSQEIGNNIGQSNQETTTLVNSENNNTIKQAQEQVELSQTNNSLKGLQTIATESSELQQSTAQTTRSNSNGQSDLVFNQSTNADQSPEVNRQRTIKSPTSNTSVSTQQVSGDIASNRNANTTSGIRQTNNSSVSITTPSIQKSQAIFGSTNSHDNIPSSEKANNSLLTSRTEIYSLDFMPSLTAGLLNTQSKVGDYDLTLSKLDYYRSHLYFGLELGYTQARDSGSEDQFLQVHNRFGSQAKAILGYQFSQNSAIELGYQQRQVSSSWEYQTFFDNSESFVQTHLLSVAFQNSHPLFQSRWSFTNKVGYMFGFGNLKNSELNTTGDFVVSPLLNTPFRYKENFIGVESNVYHLLTGGFGFTYQVNYTFDIGINANYNFGLKPIRKSNVDYIYGEGLEGNYQGETRGKFAALNLKVLYRLRS